MSKPFWTYIFLILFVGVIWSIQSALRPYLIKLILDRLSAGPGKESFEQVIILAIILIVWTLFVVGTYRLYDYCCLKIGPAVKEKVTLFLVEHVLGHDHTFFQNNFSGSLMNKINDVSMGVREIILIFIDRICSRVLLLIIVIGSLFAADYRFGFISTIWAISLIIISGYFGKKGKDLSDLSSQKGTILTGKIVDIFSNVMSVRLFAHTKKEIDNTKNWTHERVKAEQDLDWFFLKIWAFQGLSFLLVEALCLYLLIQGWQEGKITVGDFALILGLNGAIGENMWTFSKDCADFIEHLGKTTQGLRLTTENHKVTDNKAAKNLKIIGGEIEFENVSFNHNKPEGLFHNLNVIIKSGEKVGLVGYSGSGKSTFVNLILRLFDVEKGRIMIDGQDIKTLTQESLRKQISLIPQDPALFHRTLSENIWYAKPEASFDEVLKAATLSHSNEFIEKLENKYETYVGERGAKLSGGQRQRIAIARAILKQSPILLLDEATSALDSLTESLIQESLLDLMQGSTTLVIAHRLSTILRMDRILVFEQGKIVQDGSHEELLKIDGLYKQLWSSQVSGFIPETINKQD